MLIWGCSGTGRKEPLLLLVGRIMSDGDRKPFRIQYILRSFLSHRINNDIVTCSVPKLQDYAKDHAQVNITLFAFRRHVAQKMTTSSG